MARDVDTLTHYLSRRGLLDTPAKEATRGDVSGVLSRMGRAELLRAAMRSGKRVAFDYVRKRDNVSGHYVAAPYSVRGGRYLYATDHKHGDDRIHSFILAYRLRNLEVRPQRDFSPVWATEPQSV